MKAAGTRPISEKEFMAQVVQYARLCGWAAYHTHDSRHSAKGFPDLVLARAGRPGGGGRVVMAELKVGRNEPTEEQQAWLDVLGAVPGVEVYLWRPTNFDDIQEVLR